MSRGTNEADRLLESFARDRDAAVLGRLFVGTASSLLQTALRVTRDRSLAEDALHETFLAIWQGRATFVAGRPALPWLRGVVLRKARRLARDARRRVRSAHDDPPDFTSLADPHRATIGLPEDERHRLLVALSGLPPAYREVVGRRFFAGEASPAIARDLRLAPASVRARLRRGLELLRSSLRAMLVALVATAGARRARADRALAAASIAGGLTLLTLAWWFAAARTELGQAPDPATPTIADASRPIEPVARDRREPGDPVIAPSAAATPAPTTWQLVLRFADGTPAAHVGLRATTPGNDFDLGVERIATDVDGHVELPLPSNGEAVLRSDRGPLVRAPVLTAGTRVEVILPIRGAARRIRVLGADGQPAAAAKVWLGDGPQAFDGTVVGTTDARGELTLCALATGTPIAAVAATGAAAPMARVPERGDIELRLDAASQRISGRVVGSDGTPMRGARVRVPGGAALLLVVPGNLALAPEPRLVATTDAAGRFELAIEAGQRQLLVRAAGHVPQLVTIDAPRELEVRLAPAPRFAGRVVGPDGTPLANARVLARGAAWYARAGAFTDAGGRFRFDCLPPGRVDLEVHAADMAVAFRSVQLVAHGDHDAEIATTAEPTVAVRTRTGDGDGVAGVEAAVRAADGPPVWVRRSDANGDLALPWWHGNGQGLVARRSARSPWVDVAIAPSTAGVDLDPVRLASARLQFLVVDSAGNDVPVLGITVADALGYSVLGCERLGDRWTTGLLPAGDREITVMPTNGRAAAFPVRVEALAPGECRDLGILLAPAAVTCRIQLVEDGAHAEPRLFVLRSVRGELLATATGRTAAEVSARPGEHLLSVFGERTEWRMNVPVTARGAAVDVALTVRPGVRRTILLHGLPAARSWHVVLQAADRDGGIIVDRIVEAEGKSPARVDAVIGDGRFVLDLREPAGPLKTTRTLILTGSTETVDVDCSPSASNR